MKNRKFRWDKLYKLIKVVVVLVTVYGGLAWFSKQRESDVIRLWLNECLATKTAESCDLYFRTLENVQSDRNRFLQIVFYVPTVFWGGSWIFKYLFPSPKHKSF